MVKQTALLLVLGFLLSSCGVVKRGAAPWAESTASDNKPPAVNVKTPTAISAASPGSARPITKSERAVKESLDLAYTDWKGVPYVLGGSGYNGVDCSSFMQIVFEDYFEIKLPRNTRDQMKMGKSVRKKSIQTGDMIFFKTGRNAYHVGVMINSAEFLHASTSSGVMISGLKERYWSERYLTSRRIL